MKPRAVSAAVKLLAVGNPSLDPDAYPGLPSLPQAETEVADVARNYPVATVLTNSHATLEAFLQRIAAADVVHLAGHALVDPVNANNAALLFAGRDDDRLTTVDIRRLSLPATKLVVLSACETAGGAMTTSQGPMSLGRAFLAAGAHTVVASLWPVSDAASHELLVRFHDFYARGIEPGFALRAAQLAMIRGSNASFAEPTQWAAFTTTSIELEKSATTSIAEVNK
jgi:CHAT domain-containing protein